MAKYTKVGLLQKQLRIDYLEDGDREYLEWLLESSESRIEKEINQSLDTFVDENGVLDPALVAAILIFAGDLYTDPTATSPIEKRPVPFRLNFLLQPFKKYT
ncbi:head-tail connector protein [Alistipes sp. OttesenSCG-928-L06]|nr:head-tail connector protein [Alistipes sp. OttesenSCG-928-L06]